MEGAEEMTAKRILRSDLHASARSDQWHNAKPENWAAEQLGQQGGRCKGTEYEQMLLDDDTAAGTERRAALAGASRAGICIENKHV